MKKIITLLLVILLALPALAEVVRIPLAWDANRESDLAGYLVYIDSRPLEVWEARDVVQHVFTVLPMAAPRFDAEINMNVGDTAYIRATAFNITGLESGYSNQVSYFLAPTVPPPIPEPEPPTNLPPAPPQNLRVLLTQ